MKTEINYQPEKSPEPDKWLALDEAERVALIRAYHRRTRVKIPNPQIHAILHLIVENQLAEGLEIVKETLDRLRAEGLDRHEAIHAIGWVLIRHLSNLMQATEPAPNDHTHYFQALQTLTVNNWKKGTS
jgi:thioesterase domain-containing protein